MTLRTLEDFSSKANYNIVKRLQVAIFAAKKRNTSLPHILLSGPPGLGKSSLSSIIANEMDAVYIVRTGGSISSQKDLFYVLLEIDEIQSSGKNAVLFLDEIHKLAVKSMPVEMFYSLLQDFIFYSSLVGTKLLVNGKKSIIQHNILQTRRPFTIIGATTSEGQLEKPLRERFIIKYELRPYTVDDLINVAKFTLASKYNNILIDDAAVRTLAQRARGTPRTMVNFIRSCCDRALFHSRKTISLKIVNEEMEFQEIQYDGLTSLDLRILNTLADFPRGLGLCTLAGTCNIDVNTLEDVVFPFLSRKGFIKTASNRSITDLGLKRIKAKRKEKI